VSRVRRIRVVSTVVRTCVCLARDVVRNDVRPKRERPRWARDRVRRLACGGQGRRVGSSLSLASKVPTHYTMLGMGSPRLHRLTRRKGRTMQGYAVQGCVAASRVTRGINTGAQGGAAGAQRVAAATRAPAVQRTTSFSRRAAHTLPAYASRMPSDDGSAAADINHLNHEQLAAPEQRARHL